MSICVACGANRVQRKIVTERRRSGTRLSVPAFVCDACGEQVFDLNVLLATE